MQIVNKKKRVFVGLFYSLYLFIFTVYNYCWFVLGLFVCYLLLGLMPICVIG